MNALLSQSCRDGNLSDVDRLLSEGAYGTDCSAFLIACAGGHISIVNRLISEGAANWNAGLRTACRYGRISIVQRMIAAGAVDWNGGLGTACYGGHMDIIELMIRHGADDFQTGLTEACEGNQTAVVEFQLQKGATIRSSDFRNVCKTIGKIGMVGLSISKGKPTKADLADGLAAAVGNRDVDMTALLLLNGAAHVGVFDRRTAPFVRYLLQTTAVPRSMFVGVPDIQTTVFDVLDRTIDAWRDALTDLGWPAVLQTVVVEYYANLR